MFCFSRTRKGKLCFFSVFLIASLSVKGQPHKDTLLSSLLTSSKDPVVSAVVADPLGFRSQVIYTQIDRDAKNEPHFTHYYFNHDPEMYFNPASMVKLPLALLALEKLKSIPVEKIDKYTTIQFDSSYPGQVPAYIDSTAENGLPSVAHYIRKAFLISDNDAYNRLYQFTSQQYINRKLEAKGYKQSRIIRQFMGFTEDQNRHTNEVRFLDNKGRELYKQAAAYNTDSIAFPEEPIKIGKAYYNRNDSLIKEPMDFSRQNNIPLSDLHQMLQSVIFPASVPDIARFNLDKEDRNFILKYLSQYPSETNYPYYDSSVFYDSYIKFFFRDSTHRMPEGVRVFNKTGWAYGFLTDVSYVADFENKVEYMLSATLYVNSDGVLNDNKYDYDTIGYPFLNRLGAIIYNYEKKRLRIHQPDLKEVKIKYDRRKTSDTRQPIKEVDN